MWPPILSLRFRSKYGIFFVTHHKNDRIKLLHLLSYNYNNMPYQIITTHQYLIHPQIMLSNHYILPLVEKDVQQF